MKKTSAWIWGAVLILIGVVWGLNALGLATINIFFPGWWTLFIIIPSAIGLIHEKDKSGSLIGLVIGAMLMLACQNVWNFGVVWKLFVPVILILIGAKIIGQGAFTGKKVREAQKEHRDKKKQKIQEGEIVEDEREIWAAFGGQKLDFEGKKFEDARLEAVFGGIKLSLVGAELAEKVFVRASAIFGGIKIFLPDDVNVEITSKSIFGGVQDKRKKAKNDKAKTTVYLDATCAFGGVEILGEECSE